MVVGTTTSVKHNLKAQQAENDADEHVGQSSNEDEKQTKKNEHVENIGYDCCETCGVSADKCSCKECKCHICSNKADTSEQSQPAIKSATSSTVVCGGGCIAAAQRAAAGKCPGCECSAGSCPCTKCGCPICGPNQRALNSTPCRGGNEAGKRATEGECPACGCPGGKCPCTGCKCPRCQSSS